MPNSATPRVPRIDYASMSPPELEQRVRAERGGVLPALYRMLMRDHAVADAWLSLGTAVRRSALDATTRELATCLVARLTNSAYELHHHGRIAKAHGASPEMVASLGSWTDSTVFDERTRSVLRYTEALTTRADVDDTVFEELQDHLTDEEIFSLTVTVGFYAMVSRVLGGLAVQIDDDLWPASPPGSRRREQ